jgi:SagB-type dehydrogenase family enzyme
MSYDRHFLKADRWGEWRNLETDQKKEIPMPEVQKPVPTGAKLIPLISPEEFKVGNIPLIQAIRNRKSWRKYSAQSLTLEELSFLLWATQGLRVPYQAGNVTRRNVPSGGSRHPFETYIYVNRVIDLQPGLYRYLPLEHKLLFLDNRPTLMQEVHEGSNKQFVDNCAVTFIWSVIPYRTEWRYNFLSPKIIAQDSGHLCQNLYLACEAIGAGTVALGAYDQVKMDQALGLDGEDEFTVYVAPVGKVE